MVTFNQISQKISGLRAHGAFITLALCALAPHALFSKPAIFTSNDGSYSVEVSEQAVAQSGNVLTTLVENDENAKPTIPLSIGAQEDLDRFVQQLERIAALKNKSPDVTDTALSEQLTQEIQRLSLPDLARLLKYADFYGVPVLLPALQEYLVEKIDQERATLSAQLPQSNAPEWFNIISNHARNEVFAQALMQRHPLVFFGVEQNAKILDGHIDWVRNAQFSPDGSKIVTASNDKTARVWQQNEQGQWVAIATLLGHTQNLSSAQFSPDGSKIVTASDDNTTRVWQQNEQGEWVTVATLQGHTHWVRSAQFSPDGTKIVTASRDNTARIWQQNERNEWITIATLQGHSNVVHSAQFSSDGTNIVTASFDNTARVWQRNTHNEWVTVATLKSRKSELLLSAQFSPDGTKIVMASDAQDAFVWKQNERNEWVSITTLHGHTGRVSSAQFSPDGTKIVTASSDKTARVWQPNSNERWAVKPTAILRGHTHSLKSAQFSPDGTKIATASDDNTARVWDVFDVISRNQHAGLVLTLQDVLPALQQLEDAGDDTAEKERILKPLIEKIKSTNIKKVGGKS